MRNILTDQTPEAYLAALPDGRRAEVEALHALIRDTLPDLEPRMWGRVIGYGAYHYRSAAGSEGDWFTVGLSSRKNYISLYICAVDGDGYLAERSQARLGKVKVGRSCITFKKLADLDLEQTRAVLREAVAMAGVGSVGT